MCSRVPSESRIYTWTGNRYFGSSKTSSSCQAPCCCRILPFASLHACVRIIADRLVIHNNLSSRCRSSCGALRPAEVVFRSLKYTVTGPSRSLSRGLVIPLHGLDFTQLERERERELLYRFYCFTILRTCINAHRLSIHTSLVFTFFPTTLAILPNSSSRFLHAKNTRYQTPTYLVLEPCLQISSTMPTIYHL
jgi:hypothetical protein